MRSSSTTILLLLGVCLLVDTVTSQYAYGMDYFGGGRGRGLGRGLGRGRGLGLGLGRRSRSYLGSGYLGGRGGLYDDDYGYTGGSYLGGRRRSLGLYPRTGGYLGTGSYLGTGNYLGTGSLLGGSRYRTGSYLGGSRLGGSLLGGGLRHTRYPHDVTFSRSSHRSDTYRPLGGGLGYN